MRYNWIIYSIIFFVSVSYAAMSEAREPNLVLYLNGPDKSSYNLTITLSKIDIRRGDGIWLPMFKRSVTTNSVEMTDNQILLGEFTLPPGMYNGVRIFFSAAKWIREDKTIDLVYPEDGAEFNYAFRIKDDDIIPIFINWDVEKCISSRIYLGECFSFEGKIPYFKSIAAYVTNEGSNNVSVIDKSRNKVISVIPAMASPKGIVVNKEGTRGFIVNSGADTISALDLDREKVLHTFNLELGSEASAIAITPDSSKIYVCNSATDRVSVINTTTFQILTNIPVGSKPIHLASDPKGKKVYVANYLSSDVAIIDTITNTVVGLINVEPRPIKIKVDEDGDKVYVISEATGNISVIATSTNKVIMTWQMRGRPLDLISAKGNKFFIAKTSNILSVYDHRLNIDTLTSGTGKYPWDIAMDDDIGRLYVVNRDSNSVDVFDKLTLRRIKTIQVGKTPWQMVIVK
ncbi:MAG: hypothetical protein A2073_01195 [Deltaproteobacteria bacterium GWC2_42_11]|nr:MAG: hypothetical protein A2073_01195 [Deltaproteobacteria bacterium GWC2_42_11]